MATSAGRDAHDGPPRSALVAALVVASIAVVGLFVVVAVTESGPQAEPVTIVGVPAPGADGDACRSLLGALPEQLGAYRRAAVTQPAPLATAAWRRTDSGSRDVVVLRCGLEPPDDFVTGTPVQMVDDVSWFHVADTGATTWITVDRPVFVALTLPDGSGPSPIQLVSEAVSRSMPVVAIAPRPAR